MKETLIFKQTDSYVLEADFYRWDQQCSPLIIYIHGGGLLWGQKEDLSEEVANFYNNHGYHVLSINYRLAPETKLEYIIEDIRDCFDWVLENDKELTIDKDKLAVIGSSAGGFLAQCTGTFTNKPKAIISFYGYGDISQKWCSTSNKHYLKNDLVPKNIALSLIQSQPITSATVSERFLLYLYARQTGEWIHLLTNTNELQLKALSPIYSVTEDYPPTLLLHGTNDKDVPYEQSVYMKAALTKQGVPTKLITVANGEHVFDKDFNDPAIKKIYHQVVEFLDTYVKN